MYIRDVALSMDIVMGSANCGMLMTLKSGSEIDYAQVTAYIKNNSGTTIITFNEEY